MVFICFEILYELSVSYTLRGMTFYLLGASQALKTKFTLNFNNFSTRKIILDLRLSLDKACQDLNFFLRF